MMMQEKIKEYKHKLKLSQQQVGPVFELNVEQPNSTSEKQPLLNSKSVHSNGSQRGKSCPCSSANSNLESNMAREGESIHNDSKTFPSNASSKTFVQSKEKSFPDVTHTIEQHSKKYVDEFKLSGNAEKAIEDCRLGRYTPFVMPGEVNRRHESTGTYNGRNMKSPYQQNLKSPTLVAKGDVTDNATQENLAGQVDLAQMNESKPMEVRSFHDPHHSHKFALDDMPAECMALSNPKTGTTDSINNKNNSFLLLVNSQKHQHLRSINYNTNTNCHSFRVWEMDTESKCLTCFEH